MFFSIYRVHKKLWTTWELLQLSFWGRMVCTAPTRNVATGDSASSSPPEYQKKDSPVYSTATVDDSRPSAIAVGTGAAVVFVVILAGILFLDAATIWRHLGVMKQNLSEICGSKPSPEPKTEFELKPDSPQSTSAGEPSTSHDSSVGVAGGDGAGKSGQGIESIATRGNEDSVV
ncbi:uncharacterized protein LOC143300283 [Babylonia areolata]|uniref:uncharacterized protein LOC143300283 n=1 Tax=Babylonia areolata TaxID=304850 RepID=UPI003FD02AFB